MANSISHSLSFPIKNARFSVLQGFRVSAGTPTDPTTPDTEISTDGGASFADTTEEVTTGGGNGMGYVTLTGAEMNNTSVALAFKSANCLTSLMSLTPANLSILSSGTASAGAAGTLTLAAALAYDITNCFLRTTGGTGGGGTGGANNQARLITSYNTGTGVATVTPNWETTPDATTTYDVLLPPGVTLGMLKTLNPTTAGRTLDVSSGGEAGVDWANVGSPTTSLALTGTTIATTQQVDVNTIKTQAVTCAAGVTVNTNVGTTQPVNFTGTGASALAKSDMVDIAGAAVSTSSAQIGVNTVNIGGTSQTGRDLGTSVLLSSGTGTGQLDFTSGVVKSNLAQILGTALTETAGQIAAAFKKFFNITTPTATMDHLVLLDTVTTYTGNTPQTGDSYALANGVNGFVAIKTDTAAILDDTGTSGVALPDGVITAAKIAADAITNAKIADDAIAVENIKDGTITAAKIADAAIDAATFAAGAIDAAAIADGAIDAGAIAANAITAAKIAADAIGSSQLASTAVNEIADQVWDELLAGHVVPGSSGEALAAAGAAGDPWATVLPGAYGAGTAGQLVGDGLAAVPPTGDEIADAWTARNVTGGSSAGRTNGEALAFLRNRWTVVGTTLTVYGTDDTTVLWTGTVTPTPGADPITGNNPS